jgi:alanyl-tRNA synthetase
MFGGIPEDIPSTVFTGYNDHFEEHGKITCLPYPRGGKLWIIVNPTSFYGESGGQVGDRGKLIWNNTEISIRDTKRYREIFFHAIEMPDDS